MRIIAGKFRRRKLFTNPGLTTRPITDRVKESLLEQIQKRIQGKRVADIFAGTGTIGLEVLSRGAERVTFIEKDRKAIELLRANIEQLSCEDEVLVWPADVLRCSFVPKGTQAEDFSPWETVFFDPPYAMVPSIKTGSPLWNSMRRLARENVTTPDATLVFRVPRRVDFDLPSEWEIDWSLTRSGMTIHICTKSEATTESETEAESVEPS